MSHNIGATDREANARGAAFLNGIDSGLMAAGELLQGLITAEAMTEWKDRVAVVRTVLRAETLPLSGSTHVQLIAQTVQSSRRPRPAPANPPRSYTDTGPIDLSAPAPEEPAAGSWDTDDRVELVDQPEGGSDDDDAS